MSHTNFLESHGFRKLPSGLWSNGCWVGKKRAALNYQRRINRIAKEK